MAAAAFAHHIRVRYQECDMQKVVFNAHYLAYCDETAAAWMAHAFGWDGSDDGLDWMLRPDRSDTGDDRIRSLSVSERV